MNTPEDVVNDLVAKRSALLKHEAARAARS